MPHAAPSMPPEQRAGNKFSDFMVGSTKGALAGVFLLILFKSAEDLLTPPAREPQFFDGLATIILFVALIQPLLMIAGGIFEIAAVRRRWKRESSTLVVLPAFLFAIMAYPFSLTALCMVIGTLLSRG